MSARLARRKEKVVYEDVPVVTQQTVPPKELPEDVIITTPTVGGILSTVSPPSRVVSIDTVEHEGCLEPLKRTAAQYKPAPIVTTPIPPPVELDDDKPVQQTKSNVANVKDIPREPLDEAVPGYSKIFGGKQKKPITVGDV